MMASAVTLDISVSFAAKSTVDLNDFGAYTPAGATWSADPTVTPPPANQSGKFVSPFGANSLTPYYSVGGFTADNGAASPVDLTFNADQTEFTLLWASIDSFNSVTFTDTASSMSKTFVGESSEIGGASGAFTFMANGGDTFDKITFTSATSRNPSQPSFEFATVIPVPAGVLLFGSAFLAAGALRRFSKAV